MNEWSVILMTFVLHQIITRHFNRLFLDLNIIILYASWDLIDHAFWFLSIHTTNYPNQLRLLILLYLWFLSPKIISNVPIDLQYFSQLSHLLLNPVIYVHIDSIFKLVTYFYLIHSTFIRYFWALTTLLLIESYELDY